MNMFSLRAVACASLLVVPVAQAAVTDNSFNPAVSVILDGGFARFSQDPEEYGIAGFDVSAAEGRVENEGFYTGHNELTLSSNIDSQFYGQATAVIAEHEGEFEVALEEAFIQTLGLPYGMVLKAGRFLPVIGYLNEHHLHQDFFVQRPLAYQAFLGGAFFDDGVQLSTILPIDTYMEVGVGAFRGRAQPATADDGVGALTAFARVGGDIGDSASWRVGLSYLGTTPENRVLGAGHGHGHEEEHEDEEEEEEGHEEHGDRAFTGDSDTIALDVKYEWSPNGNTTQQKLEVRGEVFYRQEDGVYADEEDSVVFDGKQLGAYLQASYKFHPNWSVGYRYDWLKPEEDLDEELHETALDAEGYKPKAHTVQVQYSTSEFSRIRASYTQNKARADETDNQVLLNFVVSLGAHGAHKY